MLLKSHITLSSALPQKEEGKTAFCSITVWRSFLPSLA